MNVVREAQAHGAVAKVAPTLEKYPLLAVHDLAKKINVH